MECESVLSEKSVLQQKLVTVKLTFFYGADQKYLLVTTLPFQKRSTHIQKFLLQHLKWPNMT